MQYCYAMLILWKASRAPETSTFGTVRCKYNKCSEEQHYVRTTLGPSYKFKYAGQ
jgi:hypothetical protein